MHVLHREMMDRLLIHLLIVVPLLLLPAQVKVMVKKAIQANNEAANLAATLCMTRQNHALPCPIICQKNVFIVDQTTNCSCSAPPHSTAFCNAMFSKPSSFPSSNSSCSSNASATSQFIKNKRKINNFTSSYENTIEYATLIQRFSSGVRLHELNSIATILSSILSGVKEPSRDEKRSFPLLIEWFHNNWELISPVLPCIQLRDENNQIIDGRREIFEKSLQNK